METMDLVDDMTFKVNFSGDGAAKLRDRVKEKLKEYMGDYTDDTLVEYVIVLLRNGRRKEEARNELKVFLSDDSQSFVSWLWEHLASNLDIYVQPQQSSVNAVTKVKSTSDDLGRRTDSYHLDSESEKGKTNIKASRSRHNREWKGLMRDAAEALPLRSTKVDNVDVDERNHGTLSHTKSLSPQPSSERKRSRHDERQHTKEEVSQATRNAPRRLLQFAVRDAVTSKPVSKSTIEPPSKRLRSVVSTSTGDSSSVVRPQRIQSVARVPNAMRTVMKAVAEAAEDAAKVKPSGSVFDRLGHDTGVQKYDNQLQDFSRAIAEDGESENVLQIPEGTLSTHFQQTSYSGEWVKNTIVHENETELATDYVSDDEGYDDINAMGNRIADVLETGTSDGNRREESMMLQYGMASRGNDVPQSIWAKDQDPLAAAAKTSNKLADTSSNASSRMPQHQQAPKGVQVEDHLYVQQSKGGNANSNAYLMRENGNPVMMGNGNGQFAANTKKEYRKTLPSTSGLHSAARPSDDADSRTIFVSNVHFAATKDDLSRHFNKFGEVLKVVIITDAATGQPKGAAYVEFITKEAAHNALSLDGTSFMSRILKVVKRSSAPQEVGSVITWPRIARVSSYTVPRFRYPFPRGIPGAYRSRLPIKTGARSMQWKRDAQPTQVEGGNPVAGGSISAPGRGLTYVRPEPKADGNPNAT